MVIEFGSIQTVDGSILPIKSHLTGFTIPGIFGAANDLLVATYAGALIPDLALRCYAIARHEYMRFDVNGEMPFTGLQGADQLDPGRYTRSMGTTYAGTLMASREIGDEAVSKGVIELIDNDKTLDRREAGDGVIHYAGPFLFVEAMLLMERVIGKDFFKRAIQEPMPEAIRAIPYLCEAEYPEISISLHLMCTDTWRIVIFVLVYVLVAMTSSLSFILVQAGKSYLWAFDSSNPGLSIRSTVAQGSPQRAAGMPNYRWSFRDGRGWKFCPFKINSLFIRSVVNLEQDI